MTITKSDLENLEQLALGLDLPEPEEFSSMDPEEVQRVSMAAMQAFEEPPSGSPLEKGGEQAWFKDYLRLKEMGWHWRVAAYIAWEASPKGSRWPETITDLATEVLGLKSPRVIYTWRKKNPAIDEVVSVMQTAPLYAHRRDVIEALIAVATDPDYKAHKDRKLFFEMLGDYTPRQKVDVSDHRVNPDDLSQLSDEELRRRAEALKNRDAQATPNAGAALERPLEERSSTDAAQLEELGDQELGKDNPIPDPSPESGEGSHEGEIKRGS